MLAWGTCQVQRRKTARKKTPNFAMRTLLDGTTLNLPSFREQ